MIDGNLHALNAYMQQQERQEEAQACFDTEMENYTDSLDNEYNKLSRDDTSEMEAETVRETIDLLVEEMRDWANDYMGYDFTEDINITIKDTTNGDW